MIRFKSLRLLHWLLSIAVSTVLLAFSCVSIWFDYRTTESDLVRRSSDLTRVLAEHFSRLQEIAFDELEEMPEHPPAIAGMAPPEITGPPPFECDGGKCFGLLGANSGLPDSPIGFYRKLKDGRWARVTVGQRYFLDLYRDISPWEGSTVVIVHLKGPILVRHPGANEVLGKDFRAVSPVYDLAARQGSGFLYENSPSDHIEKFVSYRRVPGLDAIIMVNQSRGIAFANWARMSTLRLFGLLLAVAVIAIFATMIDRQLRRLMKNQHELEQLRERRLRASQLEAIGKFTSGIAHDFNNILAAIFGNLERLEEELDPRSPAQATVAKLMRSSERARDLVRQILGFSRRGEGNLKEVDVRELVSELVSELQALAPPEVRFEVDCAPGLLVRANSTQLYQVLLNLGTNAIDAVKPRGEVRFIAARAGEWVEIRVEDTGPGLSDDVMPRLFEPFFTTKPPGSGTGLGLPLAQTLVEAHGGALIPSNRPQGGACFLVRLPG